MESHWVDNLHLLFEMDQEVPFFTTEGGNGREGRAFASSSGPVCSTAMLDSTDMILRKEETCTLPPDQEKRVNE